MLSLFFVSIVLWGSPTRADAAASLYLAPTSGTFTIGSTFSVSFYLNTGGQFVNAVETYLSYPPDKLQVISPTTGKSFIQVWLTQPTYSNIDGTLKFQGAVPTPGINTEAGLISTITFRVKNLGTAAIKILDNSRVLLNDGKGTDVLGQTTGGIYYLTLPPPAGPIVVSRTHPDQGRWYNQKDVSLEWNAPPDIQGYSYILNSSPVDDPDDISEGVKTRVVYNDLPDGTYYFHIKSLRSGEWGGVTDYAIHVDKTPPAEFKISFSPGFYTSNRRPIVDFTTTDAMSGIDHYELKVIPLDPPLALAEQNETPFFIEAAPPYSRSLDVGRYRIIVRAYDQSENYYQAESNLTISNRLFEIASKYGLRIGAFTLSWPIAGVVAVIMLIIIGYIAKKIWNLHRKIEKHLEEGALRHPAIAPKLQELTTKQKEYSGDKRLLVLLLMVSVLAFGMFISIPAFAEDDADTAGSSVEPPIVTLFPKSVSNDEIVYIGGRASAPGAHVIIYLQNSETGSTLNQAVATDKTGAWFYSFPQFLTVGKYIVWTQLKVGEELSPPSSRMDLAVAPTAIQFGKNRFSYQSLYLVLFILFAAVFFGLLAFFLYHSYHFRAKKRRLISMIKEAEESIRRGFSILHHDIEAELNVIRKIKMKGELSAEEKFREEKLLKDFNQISGYIGKEVWKIERAEEEL